jgi:CheY-like chemotaxis protein/HPt (histidine-containing phosphotransfer) domain-containing protein
MTELYIKLNQLNQPNQSDSQNFPNLNSPNNPNPPILFLSHFLFEKHKDLILELTDISRIILLIEFGDAVPVYEVRTLFMPAHVVSVANLFNNSADNFAYSSGGRTIHFTAPSAKVLIVDDIATNLKIAEGLLTPYNMELITCKSGEDAIKEIEDMSYDLIFMDHKMPGMDGIETTQYIRKMEMEMTNEYFKTVPIVALTANAIVGVKEMFLTNGFSDFLSKPIDMVELNAVLERWIPEAKQIHDYKADEIARKENSMYLISGLNVEAGLRVAGGSKDLYFEILETFIEDWFGKLFLVRNCLNNNDIDLYQTYVHGIKSSAANIGALEISETAAMLENACIRFDINFIKANTEPFLTKLDTLLHNISEML